MGSGVIDFLCYNFDAYLCRMHSDFDQVDKPWFQQWFDSRYYHLLYQDRDDGEARYFLGNLFTYLALPTAARLLDMACGSGRHGECLANLGYQVVGFDIAEAQIKEAKAKENEKLCFYQHDMRKPFHLGKFDTILNLFTSFGYFENDKENQDVINNVNAALEVGGLFVLDFMNVNYVLNNLKPKETLEFNGVTFHLNRYWENGFVKKDIVVNDQERIHHFKEKVRALDLDNFESYMKEAKLSIQKVFGNYDLEPFDSNNSERLIIIAEKQGHV